MFQLMAEEDQIDRGQITYVQRLLGGAGDPNEDTIASLTNERSHIMMMMNE